MDQRRLFLFVVLSTAILFGWAALAPRIFPNLRRPVQQPVAEDVAQPEDENAQPDDAAIAAADDGESADVAEPVADQPADDEQIDDQELTTFDERTVVLGSTDPESGFFLEVELTSTGAAIASASLSDPRYRELADRDRPLRLVGNRKHLRQTLDLSLEEIDQQLRPFGLSLAEVDWQLVGRPEKDGEGFNTAAAFSYPSPDGKFEVRKSFRLHRGNPDEPDADTAGYLLDVELTLLNRSDQPQTVDYTLQGPVGLPQENFENARYFTDVELGFIDLEAPDDIESESLAAAKVVDAFDEAREDEDPTLIPTWRDPLQYVGLDVQYFTVLLFPDTAKEHRRVFEYSQPVVVARANKASHSDISVLMHSREIELPPAADGNPGRATDAFRMFLGPKRQELLEPLGAGEVMSFGWLGIISQAMLGLLHFFHDILLVPYGIAIILLTIVVRACMYPVSRKQAASAKRMKELQPKLNDLRKKYENDKERLAKEQMEFFRKHGYNPLGGCLPLFLQLPIFFGLYRALDLSVDLRMAEFLWIDNLAAPDNLFSLPFSIPFLGAQFNLLPMITVVLFVVQQRLFMPPATTPEQEMQNKMMMYMSVFFGFLFYKVPAGLCLYFIVSSLWGIAERKLLDYGAIHDPSEDEPPEEDEGKDKRKQGGSGPSGGPRDPSPSAGGGPRPNGFLQRLMDAADEARQTTEGQRTKRDPARRDRKGGKKKSKPRRY